MSGNEQNMNDNPPLDRWRVDAVLEPDRPLWGLPQIAQVAGVGIDTVRRWHLETDAPISKPGGRYFTMRRALMQWLRAR